MANDGEYIDLSGDGVVESALMVLATLGMLTAASQGNAAMVALSMTTLAAITIEGCTRPEGMYGFSTKAVPIQPK